MNDLLIPLSELHYSPEELNRLLKQTNDNPIPLEEMCNCLLYEKRINKPSRKDSFNFFGDEGKSISFTMRMQALFELTEDEALDSWLIHKPDGSINYEPNIIMAAGLIPLIIEKDRLAFNKELLLRKAFQLG